MKHLEVDMKTKTKKIENSTQESIQLVKENTQLNSKREIDIYKDDKGDLKNIKIENIEIDNYTFKGLSLNGSEFIKVKFVRCLFQGSDFINVLIKDCEFEECDLRWATLTTAQSETNIFKNCLIRELNVIS